MSIKNKLKPEIKTPPPGRRVAAYLCLRLVGKIYWAWLEEEGLVDPGGPAPAPAAHSEAVVQ